MLSSILRLRTIFCTSIPWKRIMNARMQPAESSHGKVDNNNGHLRQKEIKTRVFTKNATEKRIKIGSVQLRRTSDIIISCIRRSSPSPFHRSVDIKEININNKNNFL